MSFFHFILFWGEYLRCLYMVLGWVSTLQKLGGANYCFGDELKTTQKLGGANYGFGVNFRGEYFPRKKWVGWISGTLWIYNFNKVESTTPARGRASARPRRPASSEQLVRILRGWGSPNIKYKAGSFPCLIQTGESSTLYLRSTSDRAPGRGSDWKHCKNWVGLIIVFGMN